MNKVIIELAISSESHHELRYPKWKSIASINLPEMVDFTISLANFLHVFVLNWRRDIWHEEETTLYLKQMRMPERLLLVGQSQEEILRDNIFKTYKPRILVGAVVDKTLPHLLVLVPAIVVCLHLPSHVVRVKMKPTNKIINIFFFFMK